MSVPAEQIPGEFAVSRLLSNHLEQVIGLLPAEQQAEAWHTAAEGFENNENHPERWERAVFCYLKSVELAEGEDLKPTYLSHLSSALLERASSGTSPEEDTQRAAHAAKEAMDGTPEDEQNFKLFKGNYGEAMFRLYRYSADISDFRAGRDAIQDAIDLASDSEDEALIEQWYGKLRQESFHLAQAMETPESINNALALFGTSTPDFQHDVDFQYYYAILLQMRYLSSGSTLDLTRSRQIVDRLLKNNSEHENYGAILSVQAHNLRMLARRTNDAKHCDEAIDLIEKSMAWIEEHGGLSNRDKATLLSSKATALLRRYDLSGEDNVSKAGIPNPDLDLAIELSRQAVKLSPSNADSAKGNFMGILGAALTSRYTTKVPSPTDLKEAISAFQGALKLQTKMFHAQTLASLGFCLRARAEKSNDNKIWELAIQTYEKGAACVESPIYYRICAADDGANCIYSRDPARAFRLFETAVELLPLLSPNSLTLADREHNLVYFENIAWSAASACLEVTGDVYEAIRLSERGRGIIANLRLNLDADLSALEVQHGQLAKDFRDVRSELSLNIASMEVNLSNGSTNANETRLQTEKFNSILTRIRSKPGFEGFLDCPTESELQSMAASGPLVMFSVTRFRSDALLITKDGLKSVSLPKLTLSEVSSYGEKFIKAITKRSVRENAKLRTQMKEVLAWLWDYAVRPVLDELGYNTTIQSDGNWPQVWWIRSGILSLLPLHAAGYHDNEPRVSAIDCVMSSYTPTIKSLQHARRPLALDSPNQQKIFVLGMSETPDQDDLVAVVQEVAELKDMFPPEPLTTIKMNATCAEALQFLGDADIFHFSGHGISSTQDPLLSCLLMQDWKTRPLTISHLLRLESFKACFAYLSACHSGGSPNSGFTLLDESLHISSAFQLVGFRTVVATLWYCHVDHSKSIATRLYKHMLNESRVVSTKRTAAGLHHAVRALRDDLRKMNGTRKLKPDDPLIWAAYIHTGA